MSLRSELKALRKLVGRSDGECPGIIVKIETIEAEADNIPEPQPPLCPLCGKKHWAPNQSVKQIVYIMSRKPTEASDPPSPTLPGNLEGDCSQEAIPEQAQQEVR
jgi:hypothetical protein